MNQYIMQVHNDFSSGGLMRKSRNRTLPTEEQRLNVPRPDNLDEVMQILGTETQISTVLGCITLVEKLGKYIKQIEINGASVGFEMEIVGVDGKIVSLTVII